MDFERSVADLQHQVDVGAYAGGGDDSSVEAVVSFGIPRLNERPVLVNLESLVKTLEQTKGQRPGAV